MAGLCGHFLRNRPRNVSQTFQMVGFGVKNVRSLTRVFEFCGWSLASILDLRSWSRRHVQFYEDRKEGFVLESRKQQEFLLVFFFGFGVGALADFFLHVAWILAETGELQLSGTFACSTAHLDCFNVWFVSETETWGGCTLSCGWSV